MSAAPALPVPAVVLGGTGYVAGELLRLLAAHPRFALKAVVSDSQPGEAVAGAFPHLEPVYPRQTFASFEAAANLIAAEPTTALFGAAPHGASAPLIDALLKRAAAAGRAPKVVDISADFRFDDAAAYGRVYGRAHGAPERLREFRCAVPEHLERPDTACIAHPGCFATAILLAIVPLLRERLIEPSLYVAGVTGSTGSGRIPVPGTHHPQRHADLYPYSALHHRHAPEVVQIAKRLTGVEPALGFVPQSGPFARGLLITAQARLTSALSADAVRETFLRAYADSPFVRVSREAPRVKEVVASNYARLSVAVSGPGVAVMVALDNLTKGAAGGAIQWMNRLHGWDESLGLRAPAPGWT